MGNYICVKCHTLFETKRNQYSCLQHQNDGYGKCSDCLYKIPCRNHCKHNLRWCLFYSKNTTGYG